MSAEDGPVTPAESLLLRAYVRDHAPVMTTIERALSMPGWQVPVPPPGGQLTPLGTQTMLMMNIAAAAVADAFVAMEDGDTTRACRRVAQLVHIAVRESTRPGYAGNAIASMTLRAALDLLAQHLPKLRGSTGLSEVADLLARIDARAMRKTAAEAGRTIDLDVVRGFLDDNSLWSSAWWTRRFWFERPRLRADFAESITWHNAAAEIVARPAHEAMGGLRELGLPPSTTAFFDHYNSGVPMTVLEAQLSIEIEMRVAVARAALAAAMAPDAASAENAARAITDPATGSPLSVTRAGDLLTITSAGIANLDNTGLTWTLALR
jgi:hypothetical protein